MLKVSKTALLFIAGIVWLAAGVNIARLGILLVQPNEPEHVVDARHRSDRCIHRVSHQGLLEDGRKTRESYRWLR